MSLRALLPLVSALLFLSGCVSRDTTLLRIGMTRDEVIQVMGKPDSVGADGQNEYLNYRITNRTTTTRPAVFSSSGNISNSTFTSTFSQPYTVRLVEGRVVSYGTGSQASAMRALSTRARLNSAASVPSALMGSAKLLSHTPNAATTGIRIKSIEPATATAGTPTEFKVRIAYALKDAASATLTLNFNLEKPTQYITTARTSVRQGSGEVEVTVTVTPKDWGVVKAFTASAVLRNDAADAPVIPLGVSNREITIQ